MDEQAQGCFAWGKLRSPFGADIGRIMTAQRPCPTSSCLRGECGEPRWSRKPAVAEVRAAEAARGHGRDRRWPVRRPRWATGARRRADATQAWIRFGRAGQERHQEETMSVRLL